MNSINELFNNVYGFEAKDKEQIDVFIDCLKERLSYHEKKYVLERYGVDLFKDEEVERNIKKLMHHPLYYEEVVGHKDEIIEIFNECKREETISISLIQRKFSKGYISAKRIIEEMVDRGLIISIGSNKYQINKSL